jgi:2-polyprenyl-3-methyl-5-hydroxy-6-metoxy-1,4-benzoquinol methylase
MKIDSPSIKSLMIGNKKPEYYKNLLIKADNGLHTQIFFIVNRLFKDRQDIKILDIACGEGAFAARLFDAGFKNINAADIDSNSFKFPDRINFTEIDLNSYSEVNHFLTNHVSEYSTSPTGSRNHLASFRFQNTFRLNV